MYKKLFIKNAIFIFSNYLYSLTISNQNNRTNLYYGTNSIPKPFANNKPNIPRFPRKYSTLYIDDMDTTYTPSYEFRTQKTPNKNN